MVPGARTISGSHGIREDPNAVGRGGRVAEVRGFLISEIERASWLFHCPDRDAVSIDHGGLKACVSKQFLDDSDIVVGLRRNGERSGW